MPSSGVLWLIIIVAAILIDVGVLALARRWLSPRNSSNETQPPFISIFGAYSPTLTWLKYRRLPALQSTAFKADLRRLWAYRPIPKTPVAISQSTLLLAIGLVLLLLGQNQITTLNGTEAPLGRWLNTNLYLYVSNLSQVLAGLPLVVLGLVLVITVLRRVPLNRAPNEDQWPEGDYSLTPLRRGWPWAAGGAGVFALLVAQLALQLYGVHSFWLWLGCVANFAVLAWIWDRRRGVVHSLAVQRADWLALLGLGLADLLIGAYRLQAAPATIVGDEGAFWTAARDLASGQLKLGVFAFGVYTYPALSSIYQGFILKLFGATLWAWRFSSVLAGGATLIPLYLLAREWFDRRVAVAACGALLTLPYFLAFTRLGYNNIHTLLPVTLTVLGVWLGLRRGSVLYLYLAGCAAGLGFYTYTAARSGLVIGLALLVLHGWSDRRRWGDWLKIALVFAAGWGLVALPHLVYGAATNALAHSHKLFESIFFNAFYGRSLFSEAELTSVAPLWVVGDTTFFYNPRLYLILLVRGVVRSWLAFQQPNLIDGHFIRGPLAGDYAVHFFLIGLGLALAGWRQKRYQYLVTWFGLTWILLSVINTAPPRYQHMVGLMPALALLIGIGVVAGLEAVLSLWPRFTIRAQHALLGLTLGGLAMAGIHNYFVVALNYYRPDLSQRINWAGFYSQGYRFLYATSDPAQMNYQSYAIHEFALNVLFQTVAVTDLSTNQVTLPLDQPTVVFYQAKDMKAAQAALAKQWPDHARNQMFYGYPDSLIGGATTNGAFNFTPANSFVEILKDSYLRPVLWFIVGLLVALIVVLQYNPVPLPNSVRVEDASESIAQ